MATKSSVEHLVARGATAHFSVVQVCHSEDTPAVIQASPEPQEEEQAGRAAGGLKRVSWTPLQRVSASPCGEVVCYADRHKIIHVTNLQPEEALPEVQVKAAPAVQKRALSDTLDPPAFQRFSWQSPKTTGSPRRRVPARDPGPDPAEYAIRRYRDSRGVWHITNEPDPEAWSQPALAAVVAGDVSPALVIKPVDLLGGLGLTREQTQAQGSTVIAQRDRRGALHVSTLDSPGVLQARGDPASFLKRVSPSLVAIIVEASQLTGLPVSLVLAIIPNESNFAPMAVSPKGAMGLMQLMPGTAASLGVDDPFAPRKNVLADCRYFRGLLDCFQRSALALAAYNAGHQRVISADGKFLPSKSPRLLTGLCGSITFWKNKLRLRNI